MQSGAQTQRALRWLTLAASGGFVFQVTGCAAGFSPVIVSVLEQVALEWILGALFPPLII